MAGVPQLSLNEATELRRLINLVDTCYDGRVLLVLSAAQPMDALFKATGAPTAGRGRTRSNRKGSDSPAAGVLSNRKGSDSPAAG
eukprot:914666-Prymnesium_polylepis.2